MNETLPLPTPEPVARLMAEAVGGRVFPGAVIVAGSGESVFLNKAFGRSTYASHSWKVCPDTIFDIASLSKVVATTTIAMLLYDRGQLDLEASVARYLPGFGESGKRQEVTLRRLLAHTSGLPGYVPYFKKTPNRTELLQALLTTPLEADPGERTLYSDPGFMILGLVLKQITEETLDCVFHKEIAGPLGMNRTRFAPPHALRPFTAPTENDTEFRKGVIQGEVHDENAWVLGGVAGHAGLFSTGRDVARFAQVMLHKGRVGSFNLCKPETLKIFLERQGPEQQGEIGRRLGWDLPSPRGSTGKHFSPSTFGHLGYTGCSLWIDPENDFFVALLTNRVCPTRENKKIQEFRPRIHDALVEAYRGDK